MVRFAGRVGEQLSCNGLTVGIEPNDRACACRLHFFQVPLGQKPGERRLGLLQTAVYLFFHHAPSSHTLDGIDGLRIPQEITEYVLDRVPR